MAMTAKLFSISALSTELARDRRTIAKALSHTRPDGKTAGGDDAWFLVTALTALDRKEDRRGRHGGGDDGDIRELEFVERKLRAFFEKLRAEPDIEKRRAMIEAGEAAVLGEFERALEHARAHNSEATRQVEQPFINQMLGGMISELLSLCQLKLDASK